MNDSNNTEENKSQRRAVPVPTGEDEMVPENEQSGNTRFGRFPRKHRKSIMSEKEVYKYENERDRQKIRLKDHAFWLLCACLAAQLILYYSDSFLLTKGYTSSETLNNILEMSKTVATFLLGYLYSNKKDE